MFKDVYYIKKTFKLAKKAEGCTSPNPLVGALIVKNNKIISKGYHKALGLPHAEIEAIKQAGENLKGTTLYVNLEPCCHFGRTPPCIDEIIKSGIKKVVIATVDPNKKVEGRSIEKLKKYNIAVDVGICSEEAQRINEVFFKNMKKKLPFVVAKVAQSLDGKIATHKGVSRWITSFSSREFARSLRDKYDAVLVGRNTFIKDNPRLDGLKKSPFKVVISPKLIFPSSSVILRRNPDKLLIFTSEKNSNRRIPLKVKVFFLKENKGYLSLKDVLNILFNLGIMSVFVEGGSETLGNFFVNKLVDKAYFFISPKIIGGKSALSSIGSEGFSSPAGSPNLENVKVRHIGQDLFIVGYPKYK